MNLEQEPGKEQGCGVTAYRVSRLSEMSKNASQSHQRDKRLSKDILEMWVWLAALLWCWCLPCPTHITSPETGNDRGATLNGAICGTQLMEFLG